jgi:hypothetical protein
MDEPKWKRFEKLVAKIQADLAPTATVRHNERIYGRKSETERQVDVAIRQSIGQFEVLIVIDAKDHRAPADIPEVGGFIDLVSDIGAQRGAMVSASGFTEGAKHRAREAGIDLYRLVDAESKDWRSYVSLGVLARCNRLKEAAFAVKGPSWLAELEIERILLFNANGQRLGVPTELVARRWNDNFLPQTPGIHEGLELASEPMFVRREGRFYPVWIRAEIEVEEEIYFGKLPLSKIQGFQNVQTGGVVTRGFTTELLSYELIRTEWQRLETKDGLAVAIGLEIELVVLC